MRLIDADTLMKEFEDPEPSQTTSTGIHIGWAIGLVTVRNRLRKAPTIDIDSIITEHENIGYEKGFRDGYAEAVDAEHIKHGHWIKVEHLYSGVSRYECSVCNYADEHNESREVPYCWHCGAKMDAEEEPNEADLSGND